MRRKRLKRAAKSAFAPAGERAVEAELNRALTAAELTDLEAEIREAARDCQAAEVDAGEISVRRRHRPELVWVNPRR